MANIVGGRCIDVVSFSYLSIGQSLLPEIPYHCLVLFAKFSFSGWYAMSVHRIAHNVTGCTKTLGHLGIGQVFFMVQAFKIVGIELAPGWVEKAHGKRIAEYGVMDTITRARSKRMMIATKAAVPGLYLSILSLLVGMKNHQMLPVPSSACSGHAIKGPSAPVLGYVTQSGRQAMPQPTGQALPRGTMATASQSQHFTK